MSYQSLNNFSFSYFYQLGHIKNSQYIKCKTSFDLNLKGKVTIKTTPYKVYIVTKERDMTHIYILLNNVNVKQYKNSLIIINII